MKYQLALLVYVCLFMFASCGEGEDKIEGKYTMTELTFSGCQSPLGSDQLMFDNGGLCITEDGIYGCVFFCLEFTDTSLTINIRITEDGVEVANINQSASFDAESETIDFCLPGGTCEGVTISDNKDKITFTGIEDDFGCTFRMVLER